jgi:flagellar hook protein FlgE
MRGSRAERRADGKFGPAGRFRPGRFCRPADMGASKLSVKSLTGIGKTFWHSACDGQAETFRPLEATMSLFASLTTAITGLNAQQDAIANISDNISNAQTIGFKEINTSFQNLVTSSTPQLNQPGGVIAAPVYENSLAGNLTPSAVTTNLAISGQGFFQVKAPPAAVASGQAPTFSQQDLYTQAGDFTVNAQGFLVNSAGYYLTAYQVNPQTNVVDTSTTVPVQISQLVDAPEATQNVNMSANMPSNYPLQTLPGPPPTANGAYTAPPVITESVIDANGATQTEKIQLQHTATDTWTATISDGSASSTDEPAVLQFNFSNGSTAGFPAGTLQSITNITPNPTAPATLPVVVPAQGVTTTPTAGQPATFSIVQNFGAGAQTINFNMGTYGANSNVTQFADTSNTVSSTLNQDGVPRGSFENVSINNNGFVDINYTNGQTKAFYQVAVAQFNDPDQLQRLQGAAFSSTIDSGAAQLDPPGVNGAGSISPSTLEGSNVDIATQFTQLITAQQVYSANSKVITTADQLLTTVINLIQG